MDRGLSAHPAGSTSAGCKLWPIIHGGAREEESHGLASLRPPLDDQGAWQGRGADLEEKGGEEREARCEG